MCVCVCVRVCVLFLFLCCFPGGHPCAYHHHNRLQVQQHLFCIQPLRLWRDHRAWIVDVLREAVADATQRHEDTTLMFWCRSGKHRSVAVATLAALMLRDAGFVVETSNLSEFWWYQQRCARDARRAGHGSCPECHTLTPAKRDLFNEVLRTCHSQWRR